MTDRRPPAPWLLLNADQDRPDLPAKARLAKPYRVPHADLTTARAKKPKGDRMKIAAGD